MILCLSLSGLEMGIIFIVSLLQKCFLSFPQVIGFGSVKIAAFIAMVGILSIVAQVSDILPVFFVFFFSFFTF